jgi:hypothetical protein
MLLSPFSVSTDADDQRLRTAGAIILQISHGYAIQEENDPFVKLAEEAMDQFSLSTAPGGFLVNLIPICRSWFTLSFPSKLRNAIL